MWTSSFVISAASIRSDSVTYKRYELMCSPSWTSDYPFRSYNAAILCFLTPSTVLLLCNASIIYRVRHLRAVVSHSCPGETEQSNIQFCTKNYTKTLRSLYVLVVVYFLLTSPYFIAKFSFITSVTGWFAESLLVLFILLMFTATAINPFIYAILRKDHRDAFMKTLEMIKIKAKLIQSMCSLEAIIASLKNTPLPLFIVRRKWNSCLSYWYFNHVKQSDSLIKVLHFNLSYKLISTHMHINMIQLALKFRKLWAFK